MNGTCKGTIFGPWGPGEGPIKFRQFQIFLNQMLCVFLLMKDIKHIRQAFHYVAWVMPQGWDLGGQKKNPKNSTKFGM